MVAPSFNWLTFEIGQQFELMCDLLTESKVGTEGEDRVYYYGITHQGVGVTKMVKDLKTTPVVARYPAKKLLCLGI